MLRDLFIEPRKNENPSILIYRRTFIIVSLIFLITSFTLLSSKMFNERPTITSTFMATNKSDVPGKNEKCHFPDWTISQKSWAE